MNTRAATIVARVHPLYCSILLTYASSEIEGTLLASKVRFGSGQPETNGRCASISLLSSLETCIEIPSILYGMVLVCLKKKAFCFFSLSLIVDAPFSALLFVYLIMSSS